MTYYLKEPYFKKQVAGIAIAIGVFIATGLAGCSNNKVEDEVRSVPWYQTNKDERAAKLAECMSDPINDATPDCINASRAENDSKAATEWGEGKGEVRTPASIYD